MGLLLIIAFILIREHAINHHKKSRKILKDKEEKYDELREEQRVVLTPPSDHLIKY